jgi:GNAT superfamily N-acetyltransferase
VLSIINIFMKTIIKKATIEDLKIVQALNLKLFQKECKDYDPLLDLDWTKSKEGTEYYAKRIQSENGCVLLAQIDGEVVGYLCGGITKAEPYRKLPKVVELENTLVLKKHRGEGIGKQLFDEFMTWCKEQKVGKIRVEASAQNEGAINFYHIRGFKDYTLILEKNV